MKTKRRSTVSNMETQQTPHQPPHQPPTASFAAAANTPAAAMRYTVVAISLHWLMAAMLFGMFGLGIYMTDLPLSPEKLQLYSWHKWAGVNLVLLVWLRLLWRVSHRPPPFPAQMTAGQKRAAHLGHVALYGFMLAIPLTGWLMSSAKGFQTVWFGVIPLPDLIEKNRELGEILALVHKGLAIGLMILVIGHTIMALKHQFKDRDGTLSRMLFGRRGKNLPQNVAFPQAATATPTAPFSSE
jgi:cytochrome b561